MTPLRTLHMNTEPTWRGGEKQTLHLITELRGRGHEAELICQPGSPLEERAREREVPVHPIRSRGDLDPVAIRRIRRVMRQGDFDVCQMHTSHAHSLGVIARGFRKRPLTVVARRVDFSIHRRGGLGLNGLKYRYGVDRYIAISNAIRDVMVRDGIAPERIEVVHSGVSPLPPSQTTREGIRHPLGIRDDQVVVGNVAHFAAHKGQIHLVRALGELRERYPQLRCILVGEGERRPELEHAIEELDLGEICHLVGFQKDIAAYLSSFDVFVMPSLMEGLCTSILDALLAELPVVASEAGGIPEIIEHGITGLLAQPGDPASLATRLATLLDDPEHGRLLAAQGKAKVESQFSAVGMAEGTLRVYERLLEERPNR